MEVNHLIKKCIFFLFLLLLCNCKKDKNVYKKEVKPSVSIINAMVKIDTNSFRKVKNVIGLREKVVDNTLFAFLKIEDDTIQFYYDYQNPNKYDRKYVRNQKVLNFISLNNIIDADTIDFYEPMATRFSGKEFYKDKNDNILIRTDIIWNDNPSYRLVQILTKTECIEFLELDFIRKDTINYYENRIIQ